MRIWPKSQTRRALIAVALILIAVALLYLILVDEWSSSSTFRRWADIFQSIVTIFAIIVGGIFALFKLQAFRDFDPHLTIIHKVTHRLLGDSYIHIDVTATLQNSSKVQIELNKGFFRLQQISPLSDEEVEELYSQVFSEQIYAEMQWPKLDEVERAWVKGELVVEPGESHPETYEFIISKNVHAVLIYTYFYNSKFAMGKRTAQGWHATTVHDIFKADSSERVSTVR